MDESLGIDAEETGEPGDVQSTETEIPVKVASLEINGQRPEVGDSVDLKVGGEVTRIVNDCAYCKVTTVNDQPIEKPPVKTNPKVDEMSRLEKMSQESDASKTY